MEKSSDDILKKQKQNSLISIKEATLAKEIPLRLFFYNVIDLPANHIQAGRIDMLPPNQPLRTLLRYLDRVFVVRLSSRRTTFVAAGTKLQFLNRSSIALVDSLVL